MSFLWDLVVSGNPRSEIPETKLKTFLVPTLCVGMHAWTLRVLQYQNECKR